LAKNIDGYRKSTYMFKDRNSIDGRLRVGPVWDFNIGYGNAFYHEGYLTSGWVIISDIYVSAYIPFWMKKLFNDSTFADQLKCRWVELREGPLSYVSIMNKIDSCSNYLDEAQQRNFSRWNILGMEIWPNYYFGETYEDEIYLLKLWIAERLNWIDNNLPGYCEHSFGRIIRSKPQESLTIFPNPAAGSSLCFIIPAISSVAQLSVIDGLGQVIFSGYLSEADIDQTRELNISGYSPGIYIVKIEDARQNWFQKLVIE